MTAEKDAAAQAGLPYLRNVWIILGTAAINILCFLLAYWGRQPTYGDILFSALVCGAGTSIINVLITDHCLTKMRRRGRLPACVPQSRWLRLLPRNKWLLILVFAIGFGLAAALLNGITVWFFGIREFRVVQCAVWQGAYSCLLSAKITQFAVLRLSQEDCALPGQPPQTGDAKILNPMPKLSAFGAWFNTVTDDFGFNMVTGLVSGGTLIVDQNVIITPTTLSGIVISALVLGLIVTLRMAYPVLKSLRDSRVSGALPPKEKAGWMARLPSTPMRLTWLLALPIMLLSLAVFWSVLTFFRFQVLNFFQFFVIRTAYVSVLSKLAVQFAIARYREPGVQAGHGNTKPGAGISEASQHS